MYGIYFISWFFVIFYACSVVEIVALNSMILGFFIASIVIYFIVKQHTMQHIHTLALTIPNIIYQSTRLHGRRIQNWTLLI